MDSFKFEDKTVTHYFRLWQNTNTKMDGWVEIKDDGRKFRIKVGDSLLRTKPFSKSKRDRVTYIHVEAYNEADQIISTYRSLVHDSWEQKNRLGDYRVVSIVHDEGVTFKMKCTVRKLLPHLEVGWLDGEDGENIYFSKEVTRLRDMQFKHLKEGQKLRVKIKGHERGLTAIEIKKV